MSGDVEKITWLKFRHLIEELKLAPTRNDQVKLAAKRLSYSFNGTSENGNCLYANGGAEV